MEVLAIIVVVVVVMLVIGSMANATPVSGWSDDKLQRMKDKLLRAYYASSEAGQTEKATEYYKKHEEVKQEIQNRKKKSSEQVATEMADELAPSIDGAAQKTIALIQKTMQEQNADFERAREIVGKRLKEATGKFLAQGMTQEQAIEAATKKLFTL